MGLIARILVFPHTLSISPSSLAFLVLKQNQEHICTKDPQTTYTKQRAEHSDADYRKVVFDLPVMLNYHSHKKPTTEEVLSTRVILSFHNI